MDTEVREATPGLKIEGKPHTCAVRGSYFGKKKHYL